MKTPIVGYQGKQLTLDFNLDRTQLSICPKCSSDIIRLADGCRICGWSAIGFHSTHRYDSHQQA